MYGVSTINTVITVISGMYSSKKDILVQKFSGWMDGGGRLGRLGRGTYLAGASPEGHPGVTRHRGSAAQRR